jgi:hypothetical protein
VLLNTFFFTRTRFFGFVDTTVSAIIRVAALFGALKNIFSDKFLRMIKVRKTTLSQKTAKNSKMNLMDYKYLYPCHCMAVCLKEN